MDRYSRRARYAIADGYYRLHAFPTEEERAGFIREHPDASAVVAGEAKRVADIEGQLVCHGLCTPPKSWMSVGRVWYRDSDRDPELGEDEEVWHSYVIGSLEDMSGVRWGRA